MLMKKMLKTGCWRQLYRNMKIAKRTLIRFAHLRIFILLRKRPRFCVFLFIRVQDPVSNFILSNYHCVETAALSSTRDGVCLFNSFSMLLSGDESKSLELRHRCCVEMVTNKAKIMLHRMFRKLGYLSPDYDSNCIKCTKPGQWSSVWMIISL